MEVQKIKYPSEEFYKFGANEFAVNVDDEQITEWINSCIESVKNQLENKVESPYAFRASGDTIVICFYSQDIEDNIFDDNNYFSVIVAKNYESADFFVGDIKKREKDEEIVFLKNQIRELQKEIEKLSQGD